MAIRRVGYLVRLYLYLSIFSIFVLTSVLATNYVVFADSDIDSTQYIPGELLITFAEGCAPSPEEVSNEPVSFGSSEIDTLVLPLGLQRIRKVVPTITGPVGEASQIIDRMYVLEFDPETEMDMLRTSLSTSPCFDRVSLNWIVPTMNRTGIVGGSIP